MTPGRRPDEIPILYCDAHLLVADKPSGLLSVRGKADRPNLQDLLRKREELRDNPAVRGVHRLDRGASGVILFARTLDAQRSLVRQFAERRVEKIYVAIVGGYVADDGQVELPILYGKKGNTVRVGKRHGKPALTRYRILQRLPGNTVLECRPLTGRMHQIRVHLAAIGHPLTVDPLYGGAESVLLSSYKRGYRPSGRHDERPLISRLTLHASALTVEHPASGERVRFEAPLPKDMRATIAQLARLG